MALAQSLVAGHGHGQFRPFQATGPAAKRGTWRGSLRRQLRRSHCARCLVVPRAEGGSCSEPSSRHSLAREVPSGDFIGNGEYQVLETLGSGSSGTTYKCKTVKDGKEVAVKALSLRSLRSWKQLDLFEREAAVLKSLRHPGIPQYLGYCEEDMPDDRRFLLIQELAPGKSLATLMREGWAPTEADVLRIAGEVLAVLRYLAARRPAVVHRDVTPSNLVLAGGGAGGAVSLVDFGGVQAAAGVGGAVAGDGVPGPLHGSTVVGTYGFMAPEQFAGGACPASDLYGLGATLYFLLTGHAPVAEERMRVGTGGIAASRRLRAVIEGLLEPMAEDRLTAEEVQELLESQRGGGGRPRRLAESRGGELGRPAGSRVEVTRHGPRLEIEIPPPGFSGDALPAAAFALVWNGFVAFWTVSALAGGGLVFALFSLPFWAAGFKLSRMALAGQFLRQRIQIGRTSWSVLQQLAVFRRGRPDWGAADGKGVKEVGGHASDLSRAGVVVAAYVNGQPQTQLVLQEGTNKVVVGETLCLEEQEWLARLINAHLAAGRELRGEAPIPPTRRSRGQRGEMPGQDQGTSWDEEQSLVESRNGGSKRATRRGQRVAQRAQRAAMQAEGGGWGADAGIRTGSTTVSPGGTIDVEFDVLED